MENYKEIQFCGLGNTIDDAVKVLNKSDMKGHKGYLTFNGVKLYTYDDIESAYKKVTGKTKTEFDEERMAENQKYLNNKKKHEASIPALTEKWIKKGEEVLDWEYREKWNEIVSIRLSDIYRGYDLEACLDIVKALNEGETLKDVKEIIEEQGHSGMSLSLVSSMVKNFCGRGPDFVEYLNK